MNFTKPIVPIREAKEDEVKIERPAPIGDTQGVTRTVSIIRIISLTISLFLKDQNLILLILCIGFQWTIQSEIVNKKKLNR